MDMHLYDLYECSLTFLAYVASDQEGYIWVLPFNLDLNQIVDYSYLININL